MPARVLRKLTRHDIRSWALTGGVAFEIHAVRLGIAPIARELNDLDFVAPAFDCLPQSLPDDFLCRHVHPFDPPGKILLQLIDAENALRIDVFRACGGTLSRTVQVDRPFGPLQLVSLDDLVARAARLLLDLTQGIPVASKHARDYLRFVNVVDPAAMEAAWHDHRKPLHPWTFREARQALAQVIRAHGNLLFTPEYSRNTGEICSRCAPVGPFVLADPGVVLDLLGYC